MEKGAGDLTDVYKQMKEQSILVIWENSEQKVRPSQVTVYIVRHVLQLVARLHACRFAHVEINPRNILLMEVDNDYSIFGEGFILVNGHRYKLVLCDRGGSINGDAEYMHR